MGHDFPHCMPSLVGEHFGKECFQRMNAQAHSKMYICLQTVLLQDYQYQEPTLQNSLPQPWIVGCPLLPDIAMNIWRRNNHTTTITKIQPKYIAHISMGL